MKTILHRAETRGYANHGWLDTHHTFSFAGYHDPERVHFGALRVLNDDIIAGGAGFGTHPHNNMEIISIPLSGAIEHKDSMGHIQRITEGEIQVMSAGTGITHSEYNASQDEEAHFLQIWIFPKEKNITPRYGQKTFSAGDRQNALQAIVSPEDDEALTIHQDAWMFLADPQKEHSLTYNFHGTGNGLYIFVISGKIQAGGHLLNERDGLAVSDTTELDITATEDARLLLIEVPL